MISTNRLIEGLRALDYQSLPLGVQLLADALSSRLLTAQRAGKPVSAESDIASRLLQDISAGKYSSPATAAPQALHEVTGRNSYRSADARVNSAPLAATSTPDSTNASALSTIPASLLARGAVRAALQTKNQIARLQRLEEAGRVVVAAGAEYSAGSLDARLRRARSSLDQQLSEIMAQLDTKQITRNASSPPIDPSLPPIRLSPRSFKDLLASHGLESVSVGASDWYRTLAEMSRVSAQRAWRARLEIEMSEATQAGWFVVFDTITYNPSLYDDSVMFGAAWERYKYSVESGVVARTMSWRDFRKSNQPITDYVRYCCVPEAHKDGRTHLHILWFIKDLPVSCHGRCPNAFRAVPNRRQVDGWPPFEYGQIAMRLAVRYTGDAFTTRLGWRWPVDVSGARIPAKNPVAVARYVAKYLSKPRPESLKCKRVRASRGLGLQAIRHRLSTLTLSQLVLLLRHPLQRRFHRYHLGVLIPTSLFRAQILLTLSRRLRNLINPQMMISLFLLESVSGKNSPPRLPEHFSNSNLKVQLSRLESFIDSTMKNMTSMDIFECSQVFSDCDKPVFLGNAPSSSPVFGGSDA